MPLLSPFSVGENHFLVCETHSVLKTPKSWVLQPLGIRDKTLRYMIAWEPLTDLELEQNSSMYGRVGSEVPDVFMFERAANSISRF